ncbi:MAG: hypothetical protein WC472_02800 [Candidatus Paceibacterota bacterium]
MKIIKWIARISAFLILAFGLPFYFGYGNPLPFINPNYSLWENIALTMLPLIFIGLALGWKYEKIGGYLVVIPIIIGFIVGLMTDANFSALMLLPLVPGILYLVVGYKRSLRK